MVAAVFSGRIDQKFVLGKRRDTGFSVAMATLNRSRHETLPRFKMTMGIGRFASVSAPSSVQGNRPPLTTLMLL